MISALHACFCDGPFLADLARRVAIATESRVPERREALYRYLRKEIGPALAPLGYTVAIHDNPNSWGGPFLVAHRIEDASLPTVLIDGHGDVVHGLAGRWREGLDPWRVTMAGDRICGRRVVDNTGRHTIAIAALGAIIAARGRLGFNSFVLLETSEEIGSPGIGDLARRTSAMAPSARGGSRCSTSSMP